MPWCTGDGVAGCTRDGVPRGGGDGVRGCTGNGVAGSGGSGVAGSAWDAVTGKRVLHVCGHLITSRMDEKRPTFPSILSHRRSVGIIFRIYFLTTRDPPTSYRRMDWGTGVDQRERPDYTLLLVRGRGRARREDRAHPAAG